MQSLKAAQTRDVEVRALIDHVGSRYSKPTGGSIALKYALRCLDNDALEKPHKIFLLGPPVRVHPLAKLTKIHRLLSWTDFFEKFKWLGVQLEFDPFKYNSFPKNGGVQSFRLSRSLLRDLAKVRKDNEMGDLPPIITFQSVVDATVLTKAVVNDLYMPMKPNGSELILFDLVRYSAMQQFMRDRGRKILDDLDKEKSLPFTLRLVTNVSTESREATLSTRQQRARAMGNGQWAMGNGQWAMGNGQWAMGDGRWAIRCR